MTPPHRIYIAAPYSAGNAHDTAANVRAAVEVAERCWAKGHEAFCPHSHSHAISCRAMFNGRPIEYERWMRYSFTMIDRWATALLVVTSSPGADRELRRATLSELVIFHGVDEVPDVSERSQQRAEVGACGLERKA